MAKDPAVLFYTSDFLTGTLTMSYEQKGKYITLLCLQHQKTLLSDKDMINICGSYDKDIYDKFIKDGEFFYNKRMKEEHEKRKNFSKSRSENRLNGLKNKKLKPKKSKSSYDNHMENENEDINVISNINNNKGIPEFLEFKTFAFDKKPNVCETDLKLKYDSWVTNGWKNGNDKKIKNWKSSLLNTLPYIKEGLNSNTDKPLIMVY